MHARTSFLLLILALGSGFEAFATADEKAAELGGPLLTEVGAERAGNTAGTIPAWTGGMAKPPAGVEPGSGYIDPYTDDPVLFTIDAANAHEYANQLSPGQRALLAAFPDSWHMNVYRSRRSAAYPSSVYDALKLNVGRAELVTEGLGGVRNAAISSPFPIPREGLEVLWNHILRWRGVQVDRLNGQAALTRGKGAYRIILFQEQVAMPYGLAQEYRFDNVESQIAIAFRQKIIAPGSEAGFGQLLLQPVDFTKSHSQSWRYNPNLRRVLRNPFVGFDSPAPNSEGLRFQDETDLFNGSPALFTWQLLGKREMYIPYNSSRLHSREVSNEDILHRNHINPALARYELHRVWVVEGTVRSKKRNSRTFNPDERGHVYSRRVFYIDEDTWQIAVSDNYDNNGELKRLGEGHMMQYYELPVPWYTLQVFYDFKARRYLVNGLDNELAPLRFSDQINPNEFSPLALDYYVR
jgi:hypothetical protein